MKEKTLEGANFWKKYERDSNLTVWKFQDFCITEILREINFEDSRSAKSAGFMYLSSWILNLENLSSAKLHKYLEFKIQSLKIGKNGSFWTSGNTKINFTLNLSLRKFLKFPHCRLLLKDWTENYIHTLAKISWKWRFYQRVDLTKYFCAKNGLL